MVEDTDKRDICTVSQRHPHLLFPLSDYISFVATIAAEEERTVITADVAGAYLRAYMKKFVLIQINKDESAILVEMYPELAEYLDDDGKLTAECVWFD